MRFLNSLSRLLGGERPQLAPEQRERLLGAWDLYSDQPAAVAGFPDEPPEATEPVARPGLAYDQAKWLKKLKRILAELPDSQPEWPALEPEGRSLGFDPAWMSLRFREEFVLLVRRAVADGSVTAEEHRTLDLARHLIGLSDVDGETILHQVSDEAQAFFGKSVEGV
jgi:hypothetical protein